MNRVFLVWGMLLLFFGMMMKANGQAALSFHGGLQAGNVLKINPVFPEIERTSLIGEIGVGWQSDGSKAWQYLHGKPEFGLSFMTFDLGNPQVLGQAYALLPNITFWGKAHKFWRFSYTFGSTLAFLPKPYHPETNPTNNVIGTRINNLTIARFRFHFLTHKPLQFAAGFCFNHFSNGNFSVPNLGVNIPAFTLEARYQMPAPEDRSPENPDLPKAAILYPGIRFGLGFTSGKQNRGPIYPVYLGSFFLNHTFGHRFRVKLGTEWFFQSDVFAFMENQELEPAAERKKGAVGGVVFAGCDVLLGKFSLTGQLGPYLNRPYNKEYTLYTKLGLQFFPFNQHFRERQQFFLGIYVHSHAGEADFAEIGMGYLF